MRIFLWRVCSGVVVTRENLSLRMEIESVLCSRCGMEVETDTHALFLCDYARAEWNFVGICIDQLLKAANSWLDVLDFFMAKNGRGEKGLPEKFTMTLRAVWKPRCGLTFEGTYKLATLVG